MGGVKAFILGNMSINTGTSLTTENMVDKDQWKQLGYVPGTMMIQLTWPRVDEIKTLGLHCTKIQIFNLFSYAICIIFCSKLRDFFYVQ